MKPRPDSGSIGSDINGFGPRRRSLLRLVLTIGIAVGAVFILYLLEPGWFSTPTGATPSTPGNSTPVAAPTATPTPRPRPRRQPYLGSEQIVDDIAITPLRVDYTTGQGTQIAHRGNVFAVVTLRFVNLRRQDYTFVPDTNCPTGLTALCHFYVNDSQGEKNPPIPFDPLNTGLRAVVLQPGGFQIGSYTFEVPERDARAHTLQLLFYHDPLTDANSVRHWLLEYKSKHE